jgi:hypothetical protein
MTESIRRQLVVPPHVSAIHMAVGLGMVAVGIALVASSTAPVAALEPEVAIEAPASSIDAPREAAAASEAAAPAADEIQLVFRAGGASYMRLADLSRDEEGLREAPPHGAPRHVQEEGVEIAIAAVLGADVPLRHRAWAGKQVVVDGTCRATVTGFAVVSRLWGDTAYAGIEKPRWDAASVMHSGAQVLAARLDRCSGVFARDAALAPVVILEPIQSERLAATARSALIASTAGAEAKRSWDELKPEGLEGAWWEHAQIDARVVRHPGTGATLVAVHAHADHGCGGPDLRAWGLYRVAADGTLSPVHETRDLELHSIERIIDVEGDGAIELIGRTWLGDDVVLADEGGGERDRLDMQFYGCPC